MLAANLSWKNITIKFCALLSYQLQFQVTKTYFKPSEVLLLNICVFEILQAFEEHAEVLKARDAMIAALQSSLSAKDMELEVVY